MNGNNIKLTKNSTNVKYEFGCIMAMFDNSESKKIIEINKKLIPESFLYYEEGQEYGREYEPHITIKFGLTTNYTKESMGRLISNIKPFKIILESIDIFTNPKFDVVKFNVKSNILTKLNKLLSKLPNEDEHKVYKPHLTLAYVLPVTGKKFIRKMDKPIELLITKIKYSNPVGEYYYNLL